MLISHDTCHCSDAPLRLTSGYYYARLNLTGGDFSTCFDQTDL